jgi:hypothetical protein
VAVTDPSALRMRIAPTPLSDSRMNASRRPFGDHAGDVPWASQRSAPVSGFTERMT